MHAISERKKSGKVTPLPPLPAASLPTYGGRGELVGGQCRPVDACGVAGARLASGVWVVERSRAENILAFGWPGVSPKTSSCGLRASPRLNQLARSMQCMR